MKYATLAGLIPIFEQLENRKNKPTDATDSVPAGYLYLGYGQGIKTYAYVLYNSTSSVRDTRILLKYMAHYLKHILMTMYGDASNCKSVVNDTAGAAYPEIGSQGTEIFMRILEYGITCLNYWNIDAIEDEQIRDFRKNRKISSLFLFKDEKEVCEAFTTCYSLFDSRKFNEIFSSKLEFIFEAILRNNSVIAIVEQLLVNTQVSPLFISILLPFILKKFSRLTIEPEHEPVISRLTKIVFTTAVLSSDNVVRVIQSYVANIVISIIKHAFISRDPQSYLLLLKYLFCSISSVKSDMLYSKVTPLLQLMIDNLLSFLEKIEDPILHELLVELLLILPVKFNALVSYLPKLMSPLVKSLNAKGDLLKHGLQLLELCVDNLSRSILRSVVKPVLKELIGALRNHMLPQPYNEIYSHTAARILGKLGNMSRECLSELTYATSLISHDSSPPRINLALKEGYDPVPVSVDKIFSLSNKILLDPLQSPYLKQSAFNFIKFCLPFFIETENKFIEDAILVKELFSRAADASYKHSEGYEKLKKRLGAPSEIIKYSIKYGKDSKTIEDKYSTMLMEAVLAACINQNTKLEAEKLITSICNHFSILTVLNDVENMLFTRIDDLVNSPWLHPYVIHIQTFNFIGSVTKVLSSKSESIRELAANIVVQFFSSCLIIVGSKKNLQSLRSLSYFIYSVCNGNYKSLNDRRVAVKLGIHIIIKRLDLDPRWLRGHVLDLVRVLLCLLRDSPSGENSKSTTNIINMLVDVLKKCYDTASASPNPKETYPELRTLVSFLISELPNPCEQVRNGSKMCLNTLSGITKIDPIHLKKIVRDELVVKIISKTNTPVPYPVQMGRIDAVTYYLTLCHASINLEEDFYIFVDETLALAGAQDQLLMTKSPFFCSCVSLKILRSSAMALAYSMLTCSDFDYNQRKSLISHIVLTCIKLMYSKYPEVADDACNCLKYLISRLSPPPNELLSVGLRPILINLSDYEKLTLPCIHVLVKFLELLEDNFKIEIGNKLFEHFKEGIQQIKLMSNDKKFVNYTHRIKISVTILSVFHLLHPSSVEYIADVIENVISIEDYLNKKTFSPFRQPCIRYLSKFPCETTKYLLGRINSLPHLEFLFDIIKTPDASPISVEVFKNVTPFINSCVIDSIMSDRKHLICLKILSEICVRRPKIFLDIPKLAERILSLWNDAKKLSGNMVYENSVNKWIEVCQHLLDMVIAILDIYPGNFSALYQIIEIIDFCEFSDTLPLKKYIYEKFIVGSSIELKQSTILDSLDVFDVTYASSAMSSKLLRFIVFPIIQECMKTGTIERLITPDMMAKINNIIRILISTDAVAAGTIHSSLVLEILNLISLFISSHPISIKAYGKNIVTFMCGCLESSDMLCSRLACLLIAKYVPEYEVPLNYIYKLFYFLLNTQSFEPPQCGSLTFQALDSLVLYISKLDKGGDHTFINPSSAPPLIEMEKRLNRKIPTYVYLIWRLVKDENSTILQLIMTYHIIIKFSDLFYEYRSIFIDPIANLSRLFLSGTKMISDTDILIIGTCELIVSWFKRSELENSKDDHNGDSINKGDHKFKKSKSEDDPPSEDGSFRDDSISSRAHDLKKLILSGLIKAISYNSGNVVDRNHIMYNTKIIKNIRECVTLWGDIDVNIELFERGLSLESLEHPNSLVRICNMLGIFRIIIENKPKFWIVHASNRLLPQLEALINIDNVSVINVLIPVILGIYEAADQKITLQNNIVDMLNKRIYSILKPPSAVRHVQTKTCENKRGLNLVQVHCLSGLLNSFFTILVNHITSYTQEFIFLLERLAAEIEEKSMLQNQAVNPAGAQANSIETMMIILINSLSRMYMQDGQRKAFINFLVNIVKNMDSREISLTVMGTIRFWLSEAHESAASSRENMNMIVSVILAFQYKTDPTIMKPYLNLVADLLTDQRYSCTEMVSQLEPAFLLGLRSKNHKTSKRFLDILNNMIKPNAYNRILFCFKTRNTEGWPPALRLKQALHLIFECASSTEINSSNYLRRIKSNLHFLSSIFTGHEYNDKDKNLSLEVLAKSQRDFLGAVRKVDSSEFINALCRLLSVSDEATFSTWMEVFPACMNLVSESEHTEIGKAILSFLCNSQNFTNSTGCNSKIVQVLLESILRCQTKILLPPLLVKYLCKKFNAWHVGMDLLTNHFTDGRLYSDPMATDNVSKIREVALQTYEELLLELSENDYFFGLSRQRCVFVETNCALSYEQASMWEQAQLMYQEAQKKACSGKIPFAEAELSMWSERWISCAEKLQQWDILYDLSKYENDKEYTLECLWHLVDWSLSTEVIESIIDSLKEVPHQRRVLFEALITLKKFRLDETKHLELQKLCTEGLRLILSSWSMLPDNSVLAQIPLLHMLQGFAEIQEGKKILTILSNFNITSQENKHKEINAILCTWRERLPNFYEDINMWADITCLRRHIFQLINDASHKNLRSASGSTNLGFVFQPGDEGQYVTRDGIEEQTPLSLIGYREMAWLICKFARTLRKQNVIGASRELLTSIYAYPNVETYEVFSKLRERVMTYLNNPSDYSMGLDLLNNANTMYFANEQKAELMSIRGAFLRKMKRFDEAEASFYSSIRMEFNTKKAWALWAKFYETIFSDNSKDYESAANAVNCYMQATILFNDAGTRDFISRVIWLLSHNDEANTIGQVFTIYASETPIWYWIAFIPQLLSFTTKEAQYTRLILMRIASDHPQSLYFHLRTLRESMAQMQPKSEQTKDCGVIMGNSPNVTPQQANPESSAHINSESAVWTPRTTQIKISSFIEEEMNVIRTTYPLLYLSLETFLDLVVQRLKQRSDEDIYRLIMLLLNEGVYMLLQQISKDPDKIGPELSSYTVENLVKFSENMYPNHIKYKKAFTQDFVESKPNILQLVEKFKEWRDRLELVLESKAKKQSLDQLGHKLAIFELQHIEEVEIPGQYLFLRDNADNFLRVDRIEPGISLVQGYMSCHREITIRGHDGSLHPFLIQHPATKFSKREDNIFHLIRLLNESVSFFPPLLYPEISLTITSALKRKPGTRQQNLEVCVPTMVLLATSVRLIARSDIFVTFQNIWEDYCSSKNLHKDVITTMYIEWINKIYSFDPKAERGVSTAQVSIFVPPSSFLNSAGNG